jgi:5-formyltetrahydrofolate cyclo-ligase
LKTVEDAVFTICSTVTNQWKSFVGRNGHDQLHSIKGEIRRRKLAERDMLSESIRSEWSELMQVLLAQCFEYQHCELLHVFLSLGSEPDTSFVIEQAWRDGKRVVVPVAEAKTNTMHHRDFRSGDELLRGAYNVSVPKTDNDVTIQEIITSKSLILVPLVAFNERLYRIGYGKGYYDTFLRHCSSFSIGFGYSFLYADDFLEESHDVALDAILTEQGLVRKRV